MKLSGQLEDKGLQPFIKEKFIVKGHKWPKIWIVALDSSRAHFFRKTDHHLEKIGEAVPQTIVSSDIANENAGRMTNPYGGGGRHRFEAHDQSLKHSDALFMKSLAEFLEKAADKDAFDRIVIASDPKTLGILRPFLHKTVNDRLMAELNKDLTHLDEKQLFDYLNERLWA